MFPMDSELGVEYYMKYYADTNDTMYMCTPLHEVLCRY